VESEGKKNQNRAVFAVVIIVLAAVLFGWWLGHRNSQKDVSSNSTLPPSSVSTSSSSVKSLVSYTLPDGWSEASCPASSNTVYIAPNGTSANCNANPSTPVKVAVDSQNITDCQQVKPTGTQGIKKHTCVSVYIGGHKTIKSFTDANGTSTADYFINTGKGVVKVEYVYSGSNDFQNEFDQLANSVHVKT
jgi:hypothetical protein